MSCKCAIETDEYHGWECSITGGACMYLIPNSKTCAEEYGEGADTWDDEELNDICTCEHTRTIGERMLVDLRYKKQEVDDGVQFVRSGGKYKFIIAFDYSRKTVQAEFRYGDIKDAASLDANEIQAIHQCMIDYGWIE